MPQVREERDNEQMFTALLVMFVTHKDHLEETYKAEKSYALILTLRIPCNCPHTCFSYRIECNHFVSFIAQIDFEISLKTRAREVFNWRGHGKSGPKVIPAAYGKAAAAACGSNSSIEQSQSSAPLSHERSQYIYCGCRGQRHGLSAPASPQPKTGAVVAGA